MALLIPPGVMHVIQPLRHALYTQDNSVTYAVRHTFSPILDAEAQQLINDLQTAWNTAGNMPAVLDTNVSINPPIGYYTQSTGAALKAVQGAGATIAGLRTMSSMAANSSAIISKRTAFVGRAFRGRMFLPWAVDEGNVGETGILTPAEVTFLQTNVDDWTSSVEALASVSALALLHDETSPASGPNDITSWTVQGVIGTNRKRLRR